MADQTSETPSMEEIVLSQVYLVQAMMNLLEKKGLLTRDEILAEFNQIQNSLCDCGEDHCHN